MKCFNKNYFLEKKDTFYLLSTYQYRGESLFPWWEPCRVNRGSTALLFYLWNSCFCCKDFKWKGWLRSSYLFLNPHISYCLFKYPPLCLVPVHTSNNDLYFFTVYSVTFFFNTLTDLFFSHFLFEIIFQKEKTSMICILLQCQHGLFHRKYAFTKFVIEHFNTTSMTGLRCYRCCDAF